MIKLGTLFWLVLVSATGFTMFGVKYGVQALEEELARTRKAIMAEQQEIRVLDAEWAYLTRPESLEELNRRYLSLAPIATKQLRATLTDIPLRPPAPMPVETPAVIAEAEAAADSRPTDIGPIDMGRSDTGPVDTGPVDTGLVDAGPVDAGPVHSGPGAGQAPTVMPAPPATPAPLVASAAPVVRMTTEKPAGDRPTGAAESGKPAPSRMAAKPAVPRRPRSLDELIAQVAAGR